MTNAAGEFQLDPQSIPTSPGCYLYYGEKEEDLLYIGKAKNLRKRVSSYFQKKHETLRLQVLVSKIKRIETRVVQNETEALVLENNLIKEHQPRYNVLLRDDKNFVYLRITQEEFPKMEIVRRVIKDGSTYIGPRTATKDFKNLVRFCQKYFRVQMVKESQNYYPHLQAGLLAVSADEYQQRIQTMKQFLQGKTRQVSKELQEKMMQFAAEKKFEAAAKVRDVLELIQGIGEKNSVEFTDLVDRDCFHFVRMSSTAYAVRLVFREGKLLNQNTFEFKAPQNLTDEEVTEQLLLQFAPKIIDPPKEILLPYSLADTEVIESFLKDQYWPEKNVKIIVPQIGEKKKIMDIAQKNAQHFSDTKRLEDLSSSENFSKALPELAEVLNLESPPKRIECYDISHFSGQDTVASMVVFLDGKPATSEYKRFVIKDLPEGKIDDFASMREVLRRRFKRSLVHKERMVVSDIEMKPVETEKEWGRYHEILKTEIFERYHPEIQYNSEHEDFKKKQNNCFFFEKKGEIIGAVRLDEKGKTALLLRLFALSEGLQRQGLGAECLGVIEQWAREKNLKKILLNAQNSVVSFYEKSGYKKDLWKGDSRFKDTEAFGKLLEEQEAWELPDLIVIDGGKGQLSVVVKEVKSLLKDFRNLGQEVNFNEKEQIISLAKREEQIFRPDISDPIELSLSSPALKMLQRLRDEAHRFAITHNRARRDKNTIKSVLDEIEGIGPTTKKKLLQAFGSPKGIREASDEELLKVVNQKQFENIRHHL